MNTVSKDKEIKEDWCRTHLPNLCPCWHRWLLSHGAPQPPCTHGPLGYDASGYRASNSVLVAGILP